jgi:hypothetical protein
VRNHSTESGSDAGSNAVDKLGIEGDAAKPARRSRRSNVDGNEPG